MGRIGELAALATAVFWTITAMSFESAGKRVGSLAVNLIRLVIAFVLFTGYSIAFRGSVVPVDAGATAWTWLSVSGLVGFVIGDLLLFQAFVIIGARIAMLVYSSVPPLTALIGWFVLGERLTTQGWIGMALTVLGISIVVTQRKPAGGDTGVGLGPDAGAVPPLDQADDTSDHGVGPSLGGSSKTIGVLLAFGGAVGQAVGLVLSKFGAGLSFDPFAATQIRAIAGIVGFSLLFIVLGKFGSVFHALRDGAAMVRIAMGGFFGPFLGVSLGLFAAQNTTTGVAATIIALVPVLIIPPSVLIFGEKVTAREIVGAVVAVTGVGLLFL